FTCLRVEEFTLAGRISSSPEWERTVCLSELASLGKLGEGPAASGLRSTNPHRTGPSPFLSQKKGRGSVRGTRIAPTLPPVMRQADIPEGGRAWEMCHRSFRVGTC